ncbi:MAG: 3-oxoacyl-ACP reductase [Rhodococcus sp. (in: high G+C Gram-positive bacteria)]|uniref:3-oxoacyl-ACP reductase n=1 Tax=Rhodococcus sp. TaxID=1831 RepID=UPI003BB03CF0
MAESLSLAGRTAVVTGAGAGLGRAEALALGAAGAAVVVNDMGDAAHEVATEIAEAGGRAIAVTGDVSDWSLGERLVHEAVSRFGSMDILVNNAGIIRDKMIFNLTESDWDDVIRVHLKGHAATSHAAAVHWRQTSKDAGGPVYGRVINTSSEAFLFGSAGQPNYSAAKAGITALTLSTAQGLSRYGVRANAICPRARTAMTAQAFGENDNTSAGLDPLSPERVATLVRYLSSPASEEINGQVFVVYGKMVALMEAPKVETRFDAAGSAFSIEELDGQLTPYFTGRGEYANYAAYSVAELEKFALATDETAARDDR